MDRSQPSGVARAVPACAAMNGMRRTSGLRASTAARPAGSRPSCGPTGDEVRVRIVPRFADVLAAPEAPAVIAVDMPIGLPERTGPGGRAAENAVRPCSARGNRRCSRCRRAPRSMPADYARRLRQRAAQPRTRRARCRSSSSTSRRRSARSTKLLRARSAAAAARVFEVHPEVAFWRLNGGRALDRAEEGQEPALRAGAGAAPRIC